METCLPHTSKENQVWGERQTGLHPSHNCWPFTSTKRQTLCWTLSHCYHPRYTYRRSLCKHTIETATKRSVQDTGRTCRLRKSKPSTHSWELHIAPVIQQYCVLSWLFQKALTAAQLQLSEGATVHLSGECSDVSWKMRNSVSCLHEMLFFTMTPQT